MIRASKLHKRFGRVVAVSDLSFAAQNGEITTLLGGNGSGKTSTIRMIGALIKPDAGRIDIDGADVHGQRLRALSRLGVLHDEFGLHPRLTVAEHVRFAGELNGLSGRKLARAADDALAALGLEDIRDRRAAGLSHGQRMKTALASTIVHRPRTLVLDEPTRGLDVFSIRTLRTVLKDFRAQGCCILMSSHAMTEVRELSDRLVIIDKGRLVLEGSLQETLARAGTHDLETAFLSLIGAET